MSLVALPACAAADPISLVCKGTLSFWEPELSRGDTSDLAIELHLANRTLSGLPHYQQLEITKVTEAEIEFEGRFVKKDNSPVRAFGKISRASGRLVFMVEVQAPARKIDTHYDLVCSPFRRLF
jgi:hypothetical protein